MKYGESIRTGLKYIYGTQITEEAQVTNYQI